MHKVAAITISTLLMTSLIILVPFNSITFSNVKAQEYDGAYEDDSYSTYPTDDKKYECRTGPFEGFFVSSVEFCKHIKFDDKDNDRDRKDNNNNNQTGPQDPQGPPGFNGTQGTPGASGIVNVSNAYVVWRDNTPGNFDIFFRASQGLGTINISNNTGDSQNPQIAVSGNNVYVTWFDDTPGNNDIFVITNAQPFGTPVNISNNPGNSEFPQITTS